VGYHNSSITPCRSRGFLKDLMAIALRTLFIVVKPEEINGHMAAHGGRLLVHLPNYFIASTELPPKPSDGNSQIFKVLVEPKDVNEFVDGGKKMTVIWRGDHRTRSNPQDLVSVEVLPVNVGDPAAAVAKALPTDVCKEAFAEYPDQVKIAAVISSADPALVATLPTAPGQLKVWADSQLEAYTKTLAGG
jgi:hypothetical protein